MLPQHSDCTTDKQSVDPFGRARRVVRQLHLWIGLTLCLPLVVLGLTGSILVFREGLARLLDPPPRLTCATGKALSTAEIIASVQGRIGKQFKPYLYEAPAVPGQPATLRLIALEGGPGAPIGVRVLLVDPVSLDFVRWHYRPFPGFLHVVVQLHGDLLMGPRGRVYVGWLGIAALTLGLSGLILWWPRGNRWRSAFLVKRGARGLRLHRDLHGVVGIWTFALFVVVSFSGLYFAFPQVGAGLRKLLPSHETSNSIAPVPRREGAQRIDADRAVAAALSAVPGARLRSVAFPLSAGQPYRINLAHPGDARSAPETIAVVNPWSAELIELINPRRSAPAQTVLAWQETLHFGGGLGWVWRILVCLSGLLPAIFAFTGTSMWLIKRNARRRAVKNPILLPLQ
jgi:uncharacterized iron-regulated membrane protein